MGSADSAEDASYTVVFYHCSIFASKVRLSATNWIQPKTFVPRPVVSTPYLQTLATPLYVNVIKHLNVSTISVYNKKTMRCV